MHLQMEEVPPPATLKSDELADSLGLAHGLSAEQAPGGWRCTHCSRFQRDAGIMVWVPDAVKMGDSPEAIYEVARLNAYNGSASGWCLACALKLSRGVPWWKFW